MADIAFGIYLGLGLVLFLLACWLLKDDSGNSGYG